MIVRLSNHLLLNILILLTDEILDSKIKYPLEGYLFPATYPFYEKEPTIDAIVTVMLDKTQSVIQEYLAKWKNNP